jgi:hypothetical protein
MPSGKRAMSAGGLCGAGRRGQEGYWGGGGGGGGGGSVGTGRDTMPGAERPNAALVYPRHKERHLREAFEGEKSPGCRDS